MRRNITASVALAVTLAAGAAALAAVPAEASAPSVPRAFDTYDQQLVDDLTAEGVGGDAALFLALTKVRGRTLGDHAVQITESFPTGNDATINVTITRRAGGEVRPLEVTSHSAAGGFGFSLKYFVPVEAVPAAFRSFDGPLSDTPRVVKAAYLPASVSAGAQPTVYEVLVKGLVKKFVSDKVSEFVKYLDNRYDKTAGSALLKTLKAGLSVRDALALQGEFDTLKAQIDALEECAKNPTNPLTKKNNEQHPEELERILKQVDATRAEVTGNTAAGFIALLNKTAAGAVKGAPWLGYVIGPGTSWARENFRQVNQELINDLKNAITACDKDLKIDADLEGLWHLTGVKCGGPVGTWEIDGVVVGGESLTGNEKISFTLGENLSGSWASSGVVTSPAGSLPFTETGRASYTASPDGTSGTLSFSPGSVPVTAGNFCKEAPPDAGRQEEGKSS